MPVRLADVQSQRAKIALTVSPSGRNWVRPPESDSEGDAFIQRRLERDRIRYDPDVAAVLQVWWYTAVGAPSTSSEPLLSRRRYVSIRRRLYKALYEVYDPEDAQRAAEQEWARDSNRGAAAGIDQQTFEDGLFDLADAWIIAVESAVHTSFLWDLFCRVTVGTPPHPCSWLDEAEVNFAGYRLGEHTSTWGTWGSRTAPATSLETSDEERQVPTPVLAMPFPTPGSRPTRGSSQSSGVHAARAAAGGLGAAAWRRMALSPARGSLGSSAPRSRGAVPRAEFAELP
jgi:hypothetical protein